MTHKIDVRIISATNKNLNEAVKEKTFREDLYYRLNVLPLHLPPLRERKNDIPLLLNYFIKRESLELGNLQKRMSGDALSYLVNYRWPGNIRELENFVKYVLSTVDGDMVNVTDIPDHFKNPGYRQLPAGEALHFAEGAVVGQQAAPEEKADISFADYTWEALDKAYVRHLLEKNNWVVTRAARDAGLNRSTFDSRMKKLGIRK